MAAPGSDGADRITKGCTCAALLLAPPWPGLAAAAAAAGVGEAGFNTKGLASGFSWCLLRPAASPCAATLPAAAGLLCSCCCTWLPLLPPLLSRLSWRLGPPGAASVLLLLALLCASPDLLVCLQQPSQKTDGCKGGLWKVTVPRIKQPWLVSDSVVCNLGGTAQRCKYPLVTNNLQKKLCARRPMH